MGVARPALPAWTAEASASRARFARCMLTGLVPPSVRQTRAWRDGSSRDRPRRRCTQARPLHHQPPDAAHARTTRPHDTADQMACHSAGTGRGAAHGGGLCYFRAPAARSRAQSLALSGRLFDHRVPSEASAGVPIGIRRLNGTATQRARRY
jgi:hypothetical protein